jgi:hypothetical protein
LKGKIVLAILLLIVVIYPLSAWYGSHKIESFCNAISPGTRVEDLLRIATEYGVASKPGAKTLSEGLQKEDGTYFSFVASSFAMGETGCFIQHNGQSVITAKYEKY